MQQSALVTSLIDMLEPEAVKHGYDLVAVEQAGGRRTPVIRVFLDREGGVDLDAIAAANEWVSAALDEAQPFNGPYTLEVSSPGVDRPLRRLDDFDRFAGETVTVKTRSQSARATWTGTIIGTDGETVVLRVDEEEVRVPFGEIVKARIKGVVDFEGRKGGE